MSSAIAKLTLRMMLLAFVLGCGTSRYLIKEQLYSCRRVHPALLWPRLANLPALPVHPASRRYRLAAPHSVRDCAYALLSSAAGYLGLPQFFLPWIVPSIP